MKLATVLIAWLSAVHLAGCAVVPSTSEVGLDVVLNAPGIWGSDFVVVLAYLKAWQDTGEQSIIVFSDRVVGATSYANRNAAEAAATKLRESLRTAVPPPDSKYRDVISQTASAQRVQPAVIQLGEDKSFRITLTQAPLRLLRPGLSIRDVTSTFGKPVRVTTQLIQTDGEERPIVLTLYSYANGDIVFAESDLSPNPGTVDRVYLRVPPTVSLLFK